jgi:carbonic anhydrase
VNRLCELNVVEQVRHVCETTIAQDAWDRKQSLAVHGLVYGLDDGRLRDLGTSVASAEEVEQVYTEAVAGLAKDRPARRVARARSP